MKVEIITCNVCKKQEVRDYSKLTAFYGWYGENDKDNIHICSKECYLKNMEVKYG